MEDFFNWLRRNEKLDLYEAMLDISEDISDLEYRHQALEGIEKLKEEFKNI